MRKPTIIKRTEIYELMEDYLGYLIRTNQKDLILDPEAQTSMEAISKFKFKMTPIKEILFTRGKNLSRQGAYNLSERFNKEMKEWRLTIFLLMKTQEALLSKRKEMEEDAKGE